jgi:Rrf2 family protein
MRVSAKVEDACLAMLELAANYDAPHPVRVKNIADAHSIPQRFLVQILIQLKVGGLVNSTRGKDGGYQLARAPEEISLADVINAIDHTALAPVRRLSPKRRGPTAQSESPGAQAMQSVWRDVHAAQLKLLESTTLADLLRRTRQDALSYQI